VALSTSQIRVCLGHPSFGRFVAIGTALELRRSQLGSFGGAVWGRVQRHPCGTRGIKEDLTQRSNAGLVGGAPPARRSRVRDGSGLASHSPPGAAQTFRGNERDAPHKNRDGVVRPDNPAGVGVRRSWEQLRQCPIHASSSRRVQPMDQSGN